MDIEEARSRAEYDYSHGINIVSHTDVDITGDLISGMLLTQILYWFSPDKNGKSKIRIHKKDGDWMAKGRDEWSEEIKISPKQYDRAVKHLKELGLVETSIHKFNGYPTIHIRPVVEVYNRMVEEWKANRADKYMQEEADPFLPKGKKRNSPKVKNVIDESAISLTNITTYPTRQSVLDRVVCDAKEENKYPDFIWQSDELYENYLNFVMPKFVEEITEENDIITYYATEFIRIVRYFFKAKYLANGRDKTKRHPWYSKKHLEECYLALLRFFDKDFSADNITPFIDQLFKTRKKRDSNLLKFCNENILKGLRSTLYQQFNPDGTPLETYEFLEYNEYVGSEQIEREKEEMWLPFA